MFRFSLLFVALLVVAAARAAPPLTLEEALRLGEAASPRLAAQRLAAESAAVLVGPAAELPDPKLVFGLENVPAEGGDRWSLNRDFMTMRRVGVMQDYMSADKREARGARAAAESQREAAMLESQRAEVRRDIALAWFDKVYAARSRVHVEALLKEAALQESAARAELAGGRASPAEAIAARALGATLADRLQELGRQERRAAALLSRWLGEEAERSPGEAPDVSRLSRDVRRLAVDIHQHPELAPYASQEAAAEAELRLAALATRPDWSVELSYAQRGSAYSNMVSLMVRMDLPIFEARRQAPIAESRRRNLERVRAEIADARRRHLAEIRASLVDWETARERLARHSGELIPLAEERTRAALAAYEGGRSGLAPVLEARRAALEARLAAIAVEAELARAWAQLAFLVPLGGEQ